MASVRDINHRENAPCLICIIWLRRVDGARMVEYDGALWRLHPDERFARHLRILQQIVSIAASQLAYIDELINAHPV